MYLVAIGWIYVVLMMAAAEATSPSGTVMGALITFVLYGLLPVSLLMYIMATPMRNKARRKREQQEAAQAESLTGEPDSGGHSPGEPVTPVRKET